jgi:hypothetical protein
MMSPPITKVLSGMQPIGYGQLSARLVQYLMWQFGKDDDVELFLWVTVANVLSRPILYI